MKSLNKFLVLFSLIGLVALIGCEKNFDKINENPNNPTLAAPSALLAQAIRDFGYNDFDTWYGGRMSMNVCQHWAQRNYTSEDRYAFRSGTTDGFFRNNYIWMNNLQDIIRLNTDPATKDQMQTFYGDNRMQIACAEIMKVWAFHLLTDVFGDIPYVQALDVKNYPQPIYNTQKEIYDGLIATLVTEANNLQDVIDDGGSGFSSGDLLYGGDLEQWIKFANSLRLRLALRASNVDAGTYMPIAVDAIADGVFDSNLDNAQCKFSSSGSPNEAPIYNGYYISRRNDFVFTRQFAELLKGNNDANISFTNPYFGLRDPRLDVYQGPNYAPGTSKNGMPYGMPDTETKGYRTNLVSYSYLIPLSSASKMLKPNFPSTFLDYATVCFMKSEVAGWDATEFQNGIEASLEQWGADATASATYVSSVMTKFNDVATTAEQKKEMVITQKYIHLYMQAFEAWAEYRRTGYPKSLVKPGQVTMVLGGTPVVFTPITTYESGADICARMKYPTSEFTLNAANVNAAIVRLGEDTHAYRVWWDGGGHQ